MEQNPLLLRRWLLRNTIEALEDIATILSSRIEVSAFADQFLIGYECLTQASPEARRKILEDPRTGIWIESVESGLLACGDLLPDEPDLTAWAIEISLLSLSIALIDGVPYRVLLPRLRGGKISLPGVRMFFCSAEQPEPTLLSLTTDGTLHVNGERVTLNPVPESGGFQLSASEPLLNHPSGSGIFPLQDSDIAYESWGSLLDNASKLIALHPPSQELSRCFGSVIVPVQGESENTHCSVSFSNRPCILYMSWAPLPEIIAEAIVHESDHQSFYVHTRRVVLWNEPVEKQPCIYRSPWRDDPRPLDGILRGASAFIQVGEFAGALLVPLNRGTRVFDWAGQRAVLTLRQSLDAISVIRRHGPLSQAGRDILESLYDRARRALAGITQEPDFEKWRNTAAEKELEHDTAWQKRHQTNEKDQISLRQCPQPSVA